MVNAKITVAEIDAFLRREFPQAFGSGDIQIDWEDSITDTLDPVSGPSPPWPPAPPQAPPVHVGAGPPLPPGAVRSHGALPGDERG